MYKQTNTHIINEIDEFLKFIYKILTIKLNFFIKLQYNKTEKKRWNQNKRIFTWWTLTLILMIYWTNK